MNDYLQLPAVTSGRWTNQSTSYNISISTCITSNDVIKVINSRIMSHVSLAARSTSMFSVHVWLTILNCFFQTQTDNIPFQARSIDLELETFQPTVVLTFSVYLFLSVLRFLFYFLLVDNCWPPIRFLCRWRNRNHRWRWRWWLAAITAILGVCNRYSEVSNFSYRNNNNNNNNTKFI